MNIERFQLKGMLADAKKQFRLKDTEASGLIILLRSLLNPYIPVTEIDTEKVIVQVDRLHKIISEMKAKQIQINQMESDLE